MEKRKLAKIPREEASDEMVRFAERAAGTHIVTTRDIEKDLLMVTFYPIGKLKKGEKGAQLRTFFSKNDYISQDLTSERVKWLTAAFDRMECIHLYEYHWDRDKGNRYTPNMFFWTDADIDRMRGFFKEWSTEKDVKDWTAVTRFQDMVKQRRLDEKHAKETNPIDIVMGTVKEIPEGFKKWVSEKAMSFSRYLIYSARSKNEALVRCTHCNEVTLVDRTKIRLRNNEKGICPLCGSPVTIKARGRIPMHIWDERIVSFIEPREEGFLWRYFTAHREVKPDGKINDGLFEIVRTFYKFAPNGTPCTSSYEYREYKQTGIVRWCTDEGYRASLYCTLYPGNLPEAWKDTPMKYSALEILAENRPSEQIHYAKAINRYREFPQLEWFIKMGLYKLAAHLINEYHDGAFGYESRNGVRGLRKNGKTIFGILGLTKENTRVLQSIDGNIDELRLLQEAQSSGYNLKAEELERFYKLFGCNTTLIRKENHYHYSEDAHTYCMVAWRSPEVEKLWKILRETKWDCKDKELESHEEKYILHYCISLMQELVGCFEEWYRWVHGENAIEELSEEEKFCYNMSYFHIVQELFLFSTYHSGGTSTMAKCRQLGVDSSENVEFKFSEEEDG